MLSSQSTHLRISVAHKFLRAKCYGFPLTSGNRLPTEHEIKLIRAQIIRYWTDYEHSKENLTKEEVVLGELIDQLILDSEPE